MSRFVHPLRVAFIMQPFFGGAVFYARPAAMAAITGYDGVPLDDEDKLEFVASLMAEALTSEEMAGNA